MLPFKIFTNDRILNESENYTSIRAQNFVLGLVQRTLYRRVQKPLAWQGIIHFQHLRVCQASCGYILIIIASFLSTCITCGVEIQWGPCLRLNMNMSVNTLLYTLSFIFPPPIFCIYFCVELCTVCDIFLGAATQPETTMFQEIQPSSLYTLGLNCNLGLLP